jgi:hypothetical protein
MGTETRLQFDGEKPRLPQFCHLQYFINYAMNSNSALFSPHQSVPESEEADLRGKERNMANPRRFGPLASLLSIDSQ